MRIITYILIFIGSAIFFSSCEQVVDLDLKPAERKNVINAFITANQSCIVVLSKSQDFNNNEPYDFITRATIELSDDDGNREILKESMAEPGLYFSLMRGVVNQKYTLKVSIDDKLYEAEATIPNPVAIDSMYIYGIKLGSDYKYSPCVVYDDPEDEVNYYYSIVYVNNRLMNSFHLDDDKYTNGVKGVENILFFDEDDNNDEELKIGDHIRVEMQTLDKGMYDYYNTLTSIVEGTNPTTNIKGGALGCFKAYNPSYKELTITEKDIFIK